MAPTAQPQILHPISTSLGGDPEFFITRGGRVVEAAEVFPKGLAGLYTQHYNNKENRYDGPFDVPDTGFGKFTLDGIQLEYNMPAFTCRQSAGVYLGTAMTTLAQKLQDYKAGISLESLVELDEESFARVSPNAKVLGCAPSMNIYGDEGRAAIPDGQTYRKRSAGGHIHIGLSDKTKTLVQQYPERLVRLMDLCVGIPSVLVDRDPRNIERRTVYGRAGEFRLPAHGLEYRTLSNFWLRSYPLMSFVFGLTRLATSVLQFSLEGKEVYNPTGGIRNLKWDAESALLKDVDFKEVALAINLNDYSMARAIYDRHLRPFIAKHVDPIGQPGKSHIFALHPDLLDDFDFFLSRDPMSWFPEDPLIHWAARVVNNTIGWEAFLGITVRAAREQAAKDASTPQAAAAAKGVQKNG